MSNEQRRVNDVFGNAKTAALLAGLSALCFLFIAFRPFLVGETRFLFLLWNLFLAWLPYVVSTSAAWTDRFISNSGNRAVILTVFGIAWLLLFPNAPYLTTDFIHLVANKPLYISNGGVSYLVWYDLVLYFLFSWCGLFLGFLSTYQFHRMAARSFGEAAGWVFIAVVSVLGGYGIYLGRVVRLNSWDVIYSPFRLLYGVLESLHMRGFLFTCLFALFLFVIYVFLYSLQGKKG
ncbi:DUF1361 domain-containing protein [Paenibacillus alkalitolerans]|uniref:DUF1361 domain-containing protein n=1 Tax=Paenibacillus alkalitolerans TaxID=2799335 RepID=UPI0018F5C912|nr:DUF1361 domain-containing protein [Paenibacillus alkalitolerans]